MRFELEDRVIVRKNLKEGNKYGEIYFNKYMGTYRSMQTKIIACIRGTFYGDIYFLEGCGNRRFSSEMLESDYNYDINIHVRGNNTFATMKKNGEIVKKSNVSLYHKDKFDLQTGINECLTKLFNNFNEFVPYLSSNDSNNYGKIGEPTNLTALFGEHLFVGDMVEIYNVRKDNIKIAYVILPSVGNVFAGIMGIHSDSKNLKDGICKNFQVRKIKSFKDVKHGEEDSFGIETVSEEQSRDE